MVTDGNDPDTAGAFVRWRPAFYVAGPGEASLHNLLYLLDEFWGFLMTGKAAYESVCLHPHINVDVDDVWENLEYPSYTLEERARKLPMAIFEAHPVQGRRILQMVIQVEGDSTASFVFHGATWAFRGAFDEYGVPGAPGPTKKEPRPTRCACHKKTRHPGFKDENGYYRGLQSVDVSSQQGTERVMLVLGDGVLKRTAARVTVDGRATADSPVHAFLRSLRDEPFLHFS